MKTTGTRVTGKEDGSRMTVNSRIDEPKRLGEKAKEKKKIRRLWLESTNRYLNQLNLSVVR